MSAEISLVMPWEIWLKNLSVSEKLSDSIFKLAPTCKLLKQTCQLFIKFFARVWLMKLYCAVKQFVFIYL